MPFPSQCSYTRTLKDCTLYLPVDVTQFEPPLKEAGTETTRPSYQGSFSIQEFQWQISSLYPLSSICLATRVNILPSECYLNILKWVIEYKSEFHSECFRHLRDGNTITCGVELKDLYLVKVCYQGVINKYQAVNLALRCSFLMAGFLALKQRKKSEIGKNALCSSICSSMTTRALKLL